MSSPIEIRHRHRCRDRRWRGRVALALMREGFAVVLAGRRADKLAETASLGRAVEARQPRRCRPTSATLLSARSVLFAKTKEAFGRLDVLFNNAGIGAPAMPLEDLPLETWKKVVDTNLTGMFLCTQEAIRIMKAQTPRGGRIINDVLDHQHARLRARRRSPTRPPSTASPD